jgi:putative transposase
MSTGDDMTLINAVKAAHDVTLVLETLELPRSTYYARKHHVPSQTQQLNERATQVLRKLWTDNRKVYGAPKLHHLLQAEHSDFSSFSLKRVQRLMKKAGIVSKVIRKWRPVGKLPAVLEQENLLNQNFTTTQLNQKWSTDITYIHTLRDGWVYLSSIMDLHSRKIISWDLGRRMTDDLVVKTLERAVSREHSDLDNLIIQTDLGSQYTGIAFNEALERAHIKHSYSRKGTPYDNILIEAFHSVLKKEEVYQSTYKDFEAAYLAIFSYIEGFYNPHRIHSSLGYLTPNQMEQKALVA